MIKCTVSYSDKSPYGWKFDSYHLIYPEGQGINFLFQSCFPLPYHMETKYYIEAMCYDCYETKGVKQAFPIQEIYHG